MRAEGDGTTGTLGRTAAATGALCVGVHVATAAVGGHGEAGERAVLVAMAVACLPCVRALWRHPGVAVWRSTAVMYGGMLFVHLLLLTAAGGSSGHAGHMAGGWTWAEAGMWSGLALAGAQVALAGTVLASGRALEPRPGRPGRVGAVAD
ncbi:hypothetical protein SAMN05661080_01372 [Modestobacter sp. DSM 44400]|uniref:hypothetical protein n=1 Tax=Modestobacter sp. DSM 44400 TaxID=1550230 RepID=UPI000894F6F9|nr:hypothetical protein [Modestobacter sp. DSM 44400]SDX83280.1 hypothetical protein SAMN05661080_01372 [Modestobacter sp. DSM 44400]